MQTLLFCAGGQSSNLTPNVTPGDCFFSNGFLISPGMPFLHVPLSLGGLVSSWGRHNCCYLPKTPTCSVPCCRQRDSFPFLPLCMFFLSCSGLGECWLGALVSPFPPRSVCLMLSDWRDGFGDGSVLLLVGLLWCVDVKHEVSHPMAGRTSTVKWIPPTILSPPFSALTLSRCCTPWSSCWWGHGWWKLRSK